jgi:hypothetical protein
VGKAAISVLYSSKALSRSQSWVVLSLIIAPELAVAKEPKNSS